MADQFSVRMKRSISFWNGEGLRSSSVLRYADEMTLGPNQETVGNRYGRCNYLVLHIDL